MDQDLCLVWLYCVIDGVLRSIGRVRQRGPAPELTDAEVLTIQLWGEIRGLPNDASVWRDATTNLHGWFPNLCNEWNFVRRCGSLAKLILDSSRFFFVFCLRLINGLAVHVGGFAPGIPVTVVPRRIARSNSCS